MSPRVSVIVPAYNGGRYILSALATVQAQTLPNWELIVVDDGSTDDTAAILQQAPPDGRRQVIHQNNQGLAVARNRGLAGAGGRYLAFLDVDDGWHPEYLAQMCAVLDQAPEATAAFCGWQYMDEAGQLLPQTVLLSDQDVKLLDQDLFWRNSILPSGLVARRQAVVRVSGFDETLHACADWDLWLRLRAQGPFFAVPRVLMWYRANADSMTENVASMERERLMLNAKHLGPLDEPVANWPAPRRQAVGFTHFNAALGYFWQQDIPLGREKARRAVQCWPGLLDQDEFYYELGCAFQPRGLRGTATGLDLETSAALIHDILFTDLPPAQVRSARVHWGRACLVLARLARDTHNPRDCRAFALQALRDASRRDRIGALALLARSVMPPAWARAIRQLRIRAGAARPR